MKRFGFLIAVGLLAFAFNAPAFAGTAGATNAAACGASSTALLAAGDLGTGTVRHFILVCNNGPGLGYVAFGSSNAATALNGLPLGPMECLPAMVSTMSPNGVIALPSQLDIACIADGAATANMVAIDY